MHDGQDKKHFPSDKYTLEESRTSAKSCASGRSAKTLNTSIAEAKLPVQPDFLIGKRVAVKWDSGWFNGKVTGFHEDTFKHKVEYDDGDEEGLIIGLDVPVKVQLGPDEQLCLPSILQLERLGGILLQLADAADAEAAKANGPASRRQYTKDAALRRQQADDVFKLVESMEEGPAIGETTQPHSQATAVPQQQHALSAVLATAGADAPAALPDALIAAQQLLASGAVNAANIPGLGFTHVVWPWQQIGPNMSVEDAQRKLDQQREQRQQQASMGNELFCMDAELRDAYAEHEENRQTHKELFKELDVSLRVSPEGLVGRVLRVYWPLCDAWFPGSVEGWNAYTGQHKVVYKDGDTEQLWLGIQRVRLMIRPGEQLPPPDAVALKQLAQCYVEQAQLLEQCMQKQRRQPGGQDEIELDEEELSRPRALRDKARVLLGASYIKDIQQVPSTWAPLKPLSGSGRGSSGSGRGRGNSRGRGSSRSSSCTGVTAVAQDGVAGPMELDAVPAQQQQEQQRPEQPSVQISGPEQPHDRQQQQGSGKGRGSRGRSRGRGRGRGRAKDHVISTPLEGGTVVLRQTVGCQQQYQRGQFGTMPPEQQLQHQLLPQPQQLADCPCPAAAMCNKASPYSPVRRMIGRDAATRNSPFAKRGRPDADADRGAAVIPVDQVYAAGVTRAGVLQEVQQPQQPRPKRGRLCNVAVKLQQLQEQCIAVSGDAVIDAPEQQHQHQLATCQDNLTCRQQQQLRTRLDVLKNHDNTAPSSCSSGAATSARGVSTKLQETLSLAAASTGARAAADGSGSSSSCDSSVVMSVFPGDVVWVLSKGQPPWPALVITSEEATDFSVPQGHAKAAQVCVQFFGDYTRVRVNPLALLPTSVALDQHVWLPALLRKPCKLVDLYRLSLKEFITYCKTGELPDPEMVPEHNDERWLDDEDDTLQISDDENSAASATTWPAGRNVAGKSGTAAQERGLAGLQCYAVNGAGIQDLHQWATEVVARQQQQNTAAPAAATIASGRKSAKAAAALPLQLAPKLQLLRLGRVEFLHPRFHSEKFIWPVGFAVRRRARTPLSGGRELWHVAEILEHPDGTGPLFSVTPEGGKPVTGNSPTAAWQELYKAAAGTTATAASAACAASVPGAKLFGLQHQVVQALIQALPNAAACDRFIDWKRERPVPMILTPELLLAKRAIATRLLRLPPGIKPQPVRHIVGVCDACGDETETEDNWLVECDRCRLMVHVRCYGMSKQPDGSSWLCDVCRLPGLASPPPCVLCPRLGGAMKVTAEGAWCHLLCATWMPGMFVADHNKMEPIIGASRVSKDRRNLLCSICSQPYGACIQCAGSSKCYAAFHPSCARDAGYPMAAVWDEDSESEDEQTAPAKAAAAVGAAAAKGSKKQRKPKKSRKEGTAAGDNTRLFCFCPKHRSVAAGMSSSLIFKSSVSAALDGAAAGPCMLLGAVASTSAGAPGSFTVGGTAAAAGCGIQEVTSPKMLESFQQLKPGVGLDTQQPAVATAGAAAAPAFPNPADGVVLFGDSSQAAGDSCARSRPADTAVRRGLRAPDALAAALRKRRYVKALPYLVTSSTQAGQLLPPPASRARLTGPEFDADAQRHQQQQQQQQQGLAGCSSSTGGGSSSAGGGSINAQAAASLCNAFSAGLRALPPAGGVLSLADRYEAMNMSARSRVSSGKSAIHGLGVFAKVPHRAGDLVVEYMGHLVRPPVADMLEARTYNKMVGAGTYIFRLNADWCVDATRAGNIAHLINHSCAPCCHSRTITVRCPKTGQLRDHVAIVASRDIAVGEEMTYDYRFAGDEKLRCNCGAATCRGWVNMPSSSDSPFKRPDGSMYLLRKELAVVQQPAKDASPVQRIMF